MLYYKNPSIDRNRVGKRGAIYSLSNFKKIIKFIKRHINSHQTILKSKKSVFVKICLVVDQLASPFILPASPVNNHINLSICHTAGLAKPNYLPGTSYCKTLVYKYLAISN